MTRDIAYIVFGYLSGSVLWARIFGHLLAGKDITANTPDANPGAFNAFRNGGFWCGTLTLLFDMLKGFLPVLLFRQGGEGVSVFALALVMAAPVVGHDYSLFHNFRGGKGIAVSFGSLLGLIPDLTPALILAGAFLTFSLVVIISPHYYRTLATYIAASALAFVLVPSQAVRAGVLMISGVVIVRLLQSREVREKPEVRLVWKS